MVTYKDGYGFFKNATDSRSVYKRGNKYNKCEKGINPKWEGV